VLNNSDVGIDGYKLIVFGGASLATDGSVAASQKGIKGGIKDRHIRNGLRHSAQGIYETPARAFF
jgi:hypothetical protein